MKINSRLLVAIVLCSVSTTGCSALLSPDVNAAEQPVQGRTEAKSFHIDNALIRPLKSYDISARVLGIERYRFDDMADVVPYDLALGWGAMSEKRNLEHVDISQSKRWYFWRVDNFNNISRSQVEHNSANVHIIPANDDVFDELSDLDEHDLIRMKGYLVAADSKEWGFRSSLTRRDVGAGSCELMYVESIERLD